MAPTLEGEDDAGGGVVSDFDTPTTFATIPIGGEFIEALTTCNEVATRIAPTTHNRAKMKNAKRAGGKLIFMAEWEPVFIKEREAGSAYREFERSKNNLV
jgi:hypothetical protein